MTIRVTVKNEDTREEAVILVKQEGDAGRQVVELSGGQATTLDVWPGTNLEIAERTGPVDPAPVDAGEQSPPPAA